MDFLYFLTHAVFTNQIVAVDNVKTPAEVMRPDGVMVPSAVVGSSDEVTYWIPRDGVYVQANDKEASAYADWLLNDMQADAKINAERAAEKIALDLSGQEVVQIVGGSGWTPGAMPDLTGSGA
jgi:predicted RNA-binding protein Jag